jgi:hypothetical protein
MNLRKQLTLPFIIGEVVSISANAKAEQGASDAKADQRREQGTKHYVEKNIHRLTTPLHARDAFFAWPSMKPFTY